MLFCREWSLEPRDRFTVSHVAYIGRSLVCIWSIFKGDVLMLELFTGLKLMWCNLWKKPFFDRVDRSVPHVLCSRPTVIWAPRGLLSLPQTFLFHNLYVMLCEFELDVAKKMDYLMSQWSSLTHAATTQSMRYASSAKDLCIFISQPPL